jgi:serine O-acetyltransferase
MTQSKILLTFYNLAYVLHQYKVPILPQLINKVFVRFLFGCQISLGAKIGKDVILGNGGLGIVIHRNSVIGDHVYISPNVTIAGTTRKIGAAKIGKNTLIATGVRLLGPVTIGESCVVGANSVVINDIPDNSLAVGLPAKIIKTNIDIRHYRGDIKF